ncbi:hypothetical protein FRB94_013762 [Tulasnella sp. JGI-2019a]|nr:hypothetical protein FRB93_013319 [Tulasnella sp. JGI-2019a]KAG8990092.1 hypothetical protein FRB94_013762 [Tulasnella sp. JGI-2019a]
MQFKSSIIALIAATGSHLVSAQTTHNISVGASGLTFSPDQVNATAGDILLFQFHPGDHSVTQSSAISAPCSPLSGGIDSGFMDAATATSFPTYSVKVNDTNPLWFHCAQNGHCPAGMVFAVNVGASDFNTFMTNAKTGGTAGASGTPGTGGAGGAPGAGGTPGASGTPGAAGASGTAGTSAPAATTSASKSSSNGYGSSGARESKVVSTGLSVIAVVLAATHFL